MFSDSLAIQMPISAIGLLSSRWVCFNSNGIIFIGAGMVHYLGGVFGINIFICWVMSELFAELRGLLKKNKSLSRLDMMPKKILQ